MKTIIRYTLVLISLLITTSCLTKELLTVLLGSAPGLNILLYIENDTDNDYILKVEKPELSKDSYHELKSKESYLFSSDIIIPPNRDSLITHGLFLAYLNSNIDCSGKSANYILMNEFRTPLIKFKHQDGSKFSEVFFNETYWDSELTTKYNKYDDLLTMTFHLTTEMLEEE